MKNRTLIYLLLIGSFFSCNLGYQLNTKSWLVDEKRTTYLLNDSLHSKLELSSSCSSYTDTTLSLPLKIDKVHRFVFKESKLNRKQDVVLYSTKCNAIVFRKGIPHLKGYRYYGVYGHALYGTAFFPDTIKHVFYRKIRVYEKKRLYLIEDILPVKEGYYSVFTILQHKSKGGSLQFIDATNPDDIPFYFGIYQETLDVSRRNAKRLLSEGMNR